MHKHHEKWMQYFSVLLLKRLTFKTMKVWLGFNQSCNTYKVNVGDMSWWVLWHTFRNSGIMWFTVLILQERHTELCNIQETKLDYGQTA